MREASRWSRLKELVSETLEQPGGTRETFLAERCGDGVLFAEALQLVRAAGEDDSAFMLDPRADAFVGLRRTPSSAFVGRRVGAFTLGELIGQGGMGAVFTARQHGVEREVAVKLFPPHAMGFDTQVRFEREVRALARLEHPWVARILDAGVHSGEDTPGAGSPYIAMELVRGLPMVEHAERHELSLRSRVALLADVAEAVHAAHQRAIVHRDLKPANVLVEPPTAERPHGTPKVLDFGVARLLDQSADATRATSAGIVLGSLAYMAPEQARGDSDAIDVRTDVYALGAMLHELVAGRPPIEVEGLPIHRALAVLVEPKPSRPTIEADFTGGDLATVLDTALATEPERRYASAEALRTDLLRLLRSEPIAARRATRRYRLRKFVKRNAAASAFAAAAAAALLVATTISTISLLGEREARQQAEAAQALAERREAAAERERRRADAGNAFLTQLVWSAEPGELGREATVVQAVRSALPTLRSFAAGDETVEASLRRTVGQTFRNLGRHEEADDAFAEAYRLASGAEGPNHPQTIWIALERANNLTARERSDEAAAILEELRPRIAALPAGDERAELELALRIENAGLATARGDYQAGAEMYREALATAAARPELIEPYNLDTARSDYGLALAYSGSLDEAERVQRELAADRGSRLGETHPRTVIVRQHLAGTLTELGRFDEALTLLDEVLRLGAETWGADHPYMLSTRNSIASLHIRRGEHEAAAAVAESVLTDARRVLGDDDPFLLYVANNRSIALAQLERWDEAVPATRELLAISRQLHGEEHPFTLTFRSNLARFIANGGDKRAAVAELRDVLATQERVLGRDAAPAMITQHGMAGLLLDLGDAAEAEALSRDALQRAEANGLAGLVPHFRRGWGRALAKMGKLDEAERELTLAYEEAVQRLAPAEHERAAAALAAFREEYRQDDNPAQPDAQSDSG